MTTEKIPPFGSNKSLDILSRLLLMRRVDDLPTPSAVVEPDPDIAALSREEFEDMLALANSHHVVMRGLEVLRQIEGHSEDDNRKEWATTALAVERARIENILPFLEAICRAFEAEEYDITVIKSLDHWPDFGSDADLYTNTDSAHVVRLMTRCFQAQVAPPSWGDRLAHKRNFVIPGLPEAVEIHIGRMGQTGEQVSIAASLARRARVAPFGNHLFRVPAPSDRLMISTLQRMYRHFYFRLCDIVDTVNLSETGTIDYEDLRFVAKTAGIWKGVATYLVIVSDYVKQYRGEELDLPSFVRDSARFGGDSVYFNRGFLRVPIMPQSASLFASQLSTLLRNRELRNTARLSLLPCLATAAAVGQKITGSDKGIW